MDDIIHKIGYVSLNDITKIRNFYNFVIDDSMSGGPASSDLVKNGMEGCWDRPLRLEHDDNPLHQVIQKLHKDFGNFEIHTASVAYMAYPFAPHSDIRSTEWLREYRKKYNRGYTFLIPLAWKKDYQPGTAFFSNPPCDDEPLYADCSELLPDHHEKNTILSRPKNLGVKKIIKWQQPGELVAWKNFQWHGSLSPKGYVYDPKKWVKEFITIETGYPKI